MAKSNRTTSKARRANVARVTPLPRSIAADILRRSENGARDHQYKFGHVAELLGLLGDQIGAPHAKRSTVEWQELGQCVNYVAEQILCHAAGLGRALDGVELVRGRLAGGGAQ
jgi:hypothetical protein